MVKISTLIKFTNGNDQIASEVFRDIYNAYYKLVYFVLAKYLTSSSDIEDILVESFVSLFENRKKVTNIKYYLTTIGKNKALNFLKKRDREINVDQFVLENTITSHNSNYNDVVEELRKFLDQESVDIIIEHVVEGVSLVELSRKYNQPINTLKSKYRRALKKAGAYLGEYYEK